MAKRLKKYFRGFLVDLAWFLGLMAYQPSWVI